MNRQDQSTEQLLAAAELLLSDVRNQREAIDRRESDLVELVNSYRSQLGKAPVRRNNAVVSANGNMTDVEPHHDLQSGEDSYGQITDSVIQAMHARGRRMNAPQVAEALESMAVPIKAKSYLDAARTAIRRLSNAGKIRKVATGFYRLDKAVEAQLL